MNIFILDLDHEKNAQYHFDKHVVKMQLETAQMLCTCVRMINGEKKENIEVITSTGKLVLKKEWYYLEGYDTIDSDGIIHQGNVYGVTHKNHPCNKWLRESLNNWIWLYSLSDALHNEWKIRYNHPESKNHKSWQVVQELPEPNIKDKGLTLFAQAMPDQYKNEDAVQAYRDYYIGEKAHLASWKKRKQPGWWYENKITLV